MTETVDFSVRIQGLSLDEVALALIDRRCDPDTLVDFFAAEAEWSFYGDVLASLRAGKISGREAILDFLRRFRVEFAQKSLIMQDILVAGEQVCLRFCASYRHRGTGREAESAGLLLIRAEGDRIVEAHEFCDSALLLRLRDSAGR